MSEYPERTFIVMPTTGKFIVRIKRWINPRTRELDYYMVMIGNDPRNACVTIRAPYNRPDPLKLTYVTTDVACTIDMLTPMKGAATVEMIQLGITIARELSPLSDTMELEDCSHFTCSSPEGDKKMALPSFYIAFHGKTWYEDKFGAYVKDPILRKKYEAGILNLGNPNKKPVDFDFTNTDIDHELYPLYKLSDSWADFFKHITHKYVSKKCVVVQSWVEDAMRIVFDGPYYEIRDWVVDLKKIPVISYYEINENVPQLGGGWSHPVMERVMHRSSFYPFYRMSYKKLLRSTRRQGRRQTRRRRPTK